MDQEERLKAALADRYAIEEEIGSGGMATVYLAQDLKHDRKVAVKVLKPELAATLGAERFLLEIRVAARLNHPHILPLLDSGRTGGEADRRAEEFLYYSMPIVEGESLRAKLSREGQLSVDATCSLAKDIGTALDYAHEQGVIHRDIKPENILFHHGVLMVADFGIALALEEAGGERITRTGFSVGTPQYMSPEQVGGDRALDARSDVYAVGCVLYEALVGEPPFTGPSAIAVMARQVTDPVRPISTVRPDVPAHLANAISRALAKVPADRFGSAGRLAAAMAAPEPAPTPVRDPAVTVQEPSVHSSIAVLPFANMSADPENEYFSDGMTDEVINLLSKLPDLRVTARTSVFAFKGGKHDVREIAEKLSVDSILEGSVRRSGNQLRVAVHLVDVATGSSTWSERFDRELVDVFAIQDEIAAAIASNLSSRFLSSEISAEKSAPANLDAYDAYLKGRFYWAQGSVSALQKSVSSYERAIELEPGFAAAHAGLALTYTYQTLLMMVPEPDALARIRETIERALSLDESQADAHAAFGYLKMIADWDWAGAESEFKRAIEVSPNSASAYHQYSVLLSNLGFADRAIETSKRAVELDPLYAGAVQTLGYCYMAAGDLDEAVRLQLKTLDMEPTNLAANLMLPVMYTALGKHEEAIAAGQHGIATLGRLPILVSHLGYAHARAGEREQALGLLDELHRRSETEYVSTFFFVYIHLGLGEEEETLDWLEKAVEERSTLLMILPHWFEWDQYRDHPRFQRIYNAVGFDKHAAPRTSAAGAEPTDGRRSLAVLPFTNRSADPENEYFSDGITEDIITQLSKISALTVISRSSSMRYRQSGKTTREIGSELGVQKLVQGSVRKADDRVRITAQLIDVEADREVWAESYDRDLSDVFAIQSGVAQSIANALRAELTPAEVARIAREPTQDMEAYREYLLGRHHWSRWTEEDFLESIRHFERAIDRDPRFAEAFGALSEAWSHLGVGYWSVRPLDAYPKARDAAVRAVELDPESADANARLAMVEWWFEFAFDRALQRVERATTQNPNCAPAFDYRANILTMLGRHEEALPFGQRACELDPVSIFINANYGLYLYRARRWTEAVAQFQRTIDLDPNLPMGHALQALAYVELEDFGGALEGFERADRLSSGNHAYRVMLGYGHAAVGNRDRARQMLQEIEGRRAELNVWLVMLAMGYLKLGDGEHALDLLEDAYRERGGWTVWLGVEPGLDALRENPRFVSLMNRLGLPTVRTHGVTRR
jgi:serine/threonine-protein kinase